MVRHVPNGEGNAPLFQKVYPIFEVTPLIRPRLLLAAATLAGSPVVMGLLYHRGKDAYQSRLRFQAPGQSPVVRRTRWRHFANAAAVDKTTQQVIRRFIELAASVGGSGILQAEFSADASDDSILQTLLASGIPALFP
ncbi:MAG TPA: hypothetical protein VGX03_31180 [Candidatus Binatia bacterium]|nr:hypothetical protein [Candidatus Binatia bacterium]